MDYISSATRSNHITNNKCLKNVYPKHILTRSVTSASAQRLSRKIFISFFNTIVYRWMSVHHTLLFNMNT